MDSKFNVVYTGLNDGVTEEEFISSFCAKFGVSENKAQQIVSSTSDVVVKKNLDEVKAKKYAAAFESCGMLIQLSEIAAQTSGLSLEPMSEESEAKSTEAVSSMAVSSMAQCPKCSSENIQGDECLDCGIFISKYIEYQQKNSVQTEVDSNNENNESAAQNESSDLSQDSQTDNPYATPEAPLERNVISKEGQGSLEGGVNGDYDFTIGEIFGEAWERTKGAKGTFLLAWFFYIVVAIAINAVFSFIGPDPEILMEQGRFSEGMIWAIGPSLITIPVLYPILAGIILMGIHRSVDADINATSVFGHYRLIVPLTLLTIVSGLFTMLGFMLLILPGIYLSFAYIMSMALMVDRDMGFWEAMGISRKAVTKHWFKIFFLYLVLGLLLMIASIPMLIGLIWVLPLASIIHGVVYKYMFGVESVE